MSSSPPSLNRLNHLNAAAYVANCVVTYAVGASSSNRSNAEISAKYQTIVTPAGWAFAIWGLIFTLQLVWGIVQLFPAFRASPLVINGVGWYYIGVCAGQVLWTAFFSFELISLSLIAMLSIFFCLLKIVNSQYKLGVEVSTRDYWLLNAPFDIHCGWIIAASLVNINVVLVKWGTSATVQFTSAIVSILLLLLANVYFLRLSRPVFAIPLVLAWACFAIGQELNNPKQLIMDTFSEEQISIVRTGSRVTMTLVLASSMARAFKINVSSRQSHDEMDDEPTVAKASDPLVLNQN
jgi:hypothetical protein